MRSIVCNRNFSCVCNYCNAVNVIQNLFWYVINSKDCIDTPSVVPYAFGNYIHAEAWLHTNPSDWIKIKHLSKQVLYFLAPQTGLEPVTPRLTAACSTDWAIKAKYCTTLVLPKVVLCRHRLIFPGRFQPSIVSTDELNYRVRDGNGWTLIAKNTDYLNC